MNLASFWPFEKFTVISKLTIDEIQERMKMSVEKRTSIGHFLITNKPMPYMGNVNSKSFRIHRVPSRMDYFYPLISGTFSDGLGQTKINLQLRPLTSIVIFMGTWILTFTTICINGINTSNYVVNPNPRDGLFLPVLIPIILLILGPAISLYNFRSETEKAKKFIDNLFKSSEDFKSAWTTKKAVQVEK